ncbi:hypothetical protein ABTY59_32000 [Streptomyces sp. NPDC096079]|uniref:hypothetical protein n=1 Tax=Streptomyces sp. NPDC096079 TaxID=3155820 RepID=UPI00331B37BC
MRRLPRPIRLWARTPRLASLLAAGATVAMFGALAAIGTSDATPADFLPPQDRPATRADVAAAYRDGWAAGRIGDDNGDGRVDEDETGWDCRTMGNGLCGSDVPAECEQAGETLQLCVAIASRPPYGWTNPDGSQVDNPDGRTLLRDLDETPGTPEWADALQALDAEYREHAPRR